MRITQKPPLLQFIFRIHPQQTRRIEMSGDLCLITIVIFSPPPPPPCLRSFPWTRASRMGLGKPVFGWILEFDTTLKEVMGCRILVIGSEFIPPPSRVLPNSKASFSISRSKIDETSQSCCPLISSCLSFALI